MSLEDRQLGQTLETGAGEKGYLKFVSNYTL